MGNSESKFERYFLTDHDKEFLRGEKSLTEGSTENVRTRIRTRFRCALEDMGLLSNNTHGWNHRHLIRGMKKNDDLYQKITCSIGLLYKLASQAEIDEERIFADGIRQATALNPFVEDVDVSITFEYADVYDFEEIRQKVESGTLPTARETGLLVMYGDESVEVEYAGDKRPVIEFIREFAERRGVDDVDFQLF